MDCPGRNFFSESEQQSRMRDTGGSYDEAQLMEINPFLVLLLCGNVDCFVGTDLQD